MQIRRDVKLDDDPKRLRRLERLLWLAGGVVIGLVIGTTLPLAATSEPDTLYRKLQVLAEVFAHIENHYVDTVSAKQLVYGANRGAVATLDPHSMFFDPEEYESLLNITEGEYAGVGMELDLDDQGTPVIIAVLDGSPAHRGGLERGDLIEAIDGKSTDGLGLDRLERALRGPVGTKVKIQVRRGDDDRTWAFTVIRAWIRVPPLEHLPLGGGLHYVRLKNFPRRVALDLDQMLSKLAPEGLILDLRNNPGGLFDEAVEICDLFVSGGLIVSSSDRRGHKVEQREARERAPQAGYPVAILIDGGSASAAEVVAGALRDRGRAKLFGERSYGKGSVQTILDLSDGSGLKLTIARYFTPSGRQIDGYGIDPDEACEPPTADADPAVSAAMDWLGSQL